MTSYVCGSAACPPAVFSVSPVIPASAAAKTTSAIRTLKKITLLALKKIPLLALKITLLSLKKITLQVNQIVTQRICILLEKKLSTKRNAPLENTINFPITYTASCVYRISMDMRGCYSIYFRACPHFDFLLVQRCHQSK